MKANALAAILLAWLFMPTLSERIANALQTLTTETVYLLAAGACAIVFIIADAKGR